MHNPQALLPKPQLSVVPLPGSQPLSNARHEHYCRLRSLLCPKGQALREAGMRAVKNHDAVSNATHSKLQASKELRAMLNIGAKEQAPDITKLSDAELIQQLADQAKELGIEIDLNYRFAQKSDE